jgi:ABC-2 type transport system ATP-binding protein
LGFLSCDGWCPYLVFMIGLECGCMSVRVTSVLGDGLAIWVRGLTKAFRSRTVVDHLDLEVPAGTVCGFVGPNGAGKTTTMRMLLGLIRPTAGDGTVLGVPLGRPREYLTGVGALIDGPAFTRGLSGSDNLRVLARAGGLPLTRVPDVLDTVGLADRGADRYASYSLGMRQRLGIAAALLPRPRLLMLDEPTNGLDPAGIAEIRGLLARFRLEGITVFVSSHLLAELEQVADQVVLLGEGRAVFSGSIGELVRRFGARIVIQPEHPDQVGVLARLAADVTPPGTIETGLTGGQIEIPLPAGMPDQQMRSHAAEINRRAQALGVAVCGLQVHRPSLEDAFFQLTQERPAHDRPPQDRSAQDRSAQDQLAQDQLAQDQLAQGRPAWVRGLR